MAAHLFHLFLLFVPQESETVKQLGFLGIETTHKMTCTACGSSYVSQQVIPEPRVKLHLIGTSQVQTLEDVIKTSENVRTMFVPAMFVF